MTEKTDDIRLRVPKGLKEKYKAEAEKRGSSMTQFIISCVEKEINRWLYGKRGIKEWVTKKELLNY